jgi:para-aminobenzoate synthetase / 4-amino-4-deoxychorismate lyase
LHEADSFREYEECKLKARFLTEPPEQFELIETILWEPGTGYQLLDYHLDRLMQSAHYFSIPLDRNETARFLLSYPPVTKTPSRTRLLVDQSGKITFSSNTVEEMNSTKVRWATEPVDSADRFLYHKTTRREKFSRELDKARAEGYFEVFFMNERKEVTEGSSSNIWILNNRVYYTPPVSCGLLAGTYRRFLLEKKDFPSKESVLTANDIQQADAIFISNAIRGLVKVTIDHS